MTIITLTRLVLSLCFLSTIYMFTRLENKWCYLTTISLPCEQQTLHVVRHIVIYYLQHTAPHSDMSVK